MHTLTTARLTLAPWAPRFEVDLIRLACDPRVTQYIGDGQPWSREFAVGRHRAHLAHWQEHGFGWRAVLRADSGEFVGIAALNYLGDAVPGIEETAVEIGWWVDPQVWGQGIGTEAAVAARDEAFADVGAALIVARFQPDNHASERIMVKIGMRPYGDAVGRTGEPVRVYTLERSAWQRGAQRRAR